MNDYSRIPQELKVLVQWVCWRHELVDDKPTKILYDIRTDKRASTTDRSTWSSFEECVARANDKSRNWQYDGIGFVFTKNDPYCGIDLDVKEFDVEEGGNKPLFDLFNRILVGMDSYAEWSVSGRGMHIIVKAAVPAGRKRSNVEIYSDARYFTFTGNVYMDKPIAERQYMAQKLWEELGPIASSDYYAGWDIPEKFNELVIEDMRRGKNGDLFDLLWSGDWQSKYPSQSEADMALFNIIAFYTENRMQIVQLFRMSQLGQRSKAARDQYMNYCLNKAFDLKLPRIDFTNLVENLQAQIEAQKSAQVQTTYEPLQIAAPQAPSVLDGYDLDYWRKNEPSQLVTEFYRFVMAQAQRPVREIALAAVFGFMAGVTGRAYNVSNTGLNMYIMMLAETGRGKEAMSSGIDSLCAAINGNGELPAIYGFIGPADMASGSGLVRHMSEAIPPSYVALTGEIGIRLQQMSMVNANSADTGLRRTLLDLYMKSGAGRQLPTKVYADAKNNVAMIQSPAFSWLGESTPSEFYKSLDEAQIKSGLIPRFMIIEYNGERVPMNHDHWKARPSEFLLRSMRGLADASIMANQSGKVITVQTTNEAHEFMDRLNAWVDMRINKAEAGSFEVELWNRHALKVYKLAAIIAVGNDYHQPVINIHDMLWANSMCMTDAVAIEKRFERGDFGRAHENMQDTEQLQQVRKSIVKYYTRGVPLKPQDAHMLSQGVITHSRLTTMNLPYKAFKGVTGGSKGLDRTILELIKFGWIGEVSSKDAREKLSFSGKCYYVIDFNAIADGFKLE